MSAEVLQHVDDYNWLKRHHTLPLPGGKLAQSARFVDAVDIIDEELAKAQEFQRAREDAQAKVRAQLAKMTGVR